MKKISNIEYGALLIILMVTINSEINKSILINNVGVNSWITLIITYIVGLIPLTMFIYIGNNIKDSLSNEIIKLFKKFGYIINFFILIIFLIIGTCLLYNISQFISSQFLYRTPLIIISITLISIIIYNVNKGVETISKVGLILLSLNIILLFISTTSLIEYFRVDNLMPFLKENTSKIPKTVLLSCSNICLPFLLLLVIPKNKLDHPEKYSKTVLISYILGAFISITVVIISMGVLGIYLEKTFEYPEYIFLKKVKLFGFLERVENIVATQWIIGNFMYISLIVCYISNIIINRKKTKKYINYLISIFILILSLNIFKNNTYFDTFIYNYFSYIVLCLAPFYLLIIFKLILKKIKKT